MDPIALARAADENLATHFTWIQGHTPGMRVERASDLLATISGLPSDNFNAACGARIDPDQADRRVPEWLRWLERNAAPFAWWVGITDQPADLGRRLLAAGLRLSEREIAMAVDLSGHRPTGSGAESRWGAAVSSAGLTIRRARTSSAIADFATVTMANYAPRDPLVETFYARATEALLTDESPCWCYLGYLDEVPVACLQVTVGGGVAGLYNLATLAPYRRQGHAAAMTARALADATRFGLPIAILQVAEGGTERYHRIGFRAFGEIAEYR